MSGAIILTLNPHDRIGLATTIERLINLLDSIEPDADREPDLGFTGIATGWQEGEPTDEREGDDERDVDLADAMTDLEPNGDEGDYDGGENDPDGFIWGGGEDGKKPLMPGYL